MPDVVVRSSGWRPNEANARWNRRLRRAYHACAKRVRRLPLPLVMRPAHDPRQQPALPSRVRLLLVEDEVSTVFAMREFFAHAGYDVDCAAGPTEAGALLNRHPYEAIITDLHLTKCRRGEGMMIAAHARRQNPHACIVMLTGYGSDGTEEEARRCGVDVYQTKPVELGRLNAYVDLVLRGEPDPRWPEVEFTWRHH